MVHRTAALEGAHGIGFGRRSTVRAPGAIGFFRELPDDTDARVHSNRAAELIVSGDAELALEHLRAALRAEPTEAVHHNRLGMALKHLGRHPEASLAFDAALEREPQLASALYNKACLAAVGGRLSDALELLDGAFPAHPTLFTELAMLDPDLARLRNQPAFKALLSGSARKLDRFDS